LLEVERDGEGGEDVEFDGGGDELGEGEVADGPVGVAEDGEYVGDVLRGDEADGGEVGEAGGQDSDGFGAESADFEEEDGFDGDGHKEVMWFEAEADAGGNAYGEPGREVEAECGGGCIQRGGEDVRDTEDGEEMVALAEVSGGERGEDGDEDEGEGPELGWGDGWGDGGFEAAKEFQGGYGGGGFEEEDAEFEEGGDGKCGETGEFCGEEQHPHDEWGVGFEDFGAVKFGAMKEALGDVKAPELVVTDGGKQAEHGRHAGSGEGEDHEDVFIPSF